MPKGYRKDGSRLAFSKGCISLMKGKHHSEVAKLKMSLAHEGKHHSISTEFKKGFVSKEKHPNWKGGIKANPILRNNYLKKWRQENPLSVKADHHKRRIFMSSLTLQIVQQVYEGNIKRYGTLTCYLCLNPIEFGKDHLEHKTPISRGGTNARENLDIACQQCNCKKHTKTEEEFKKEAIC